jgi:threonine dehydrogenase-like Zn-dependent dehydrogenase
MRALVLDRGGLAGLAVRTVAAPEPRLGEVVVRVRACAVCQSDLHLIRDKAPALGRFGASGDGEAGAWHVPGHELAGDVAAAGPGVAGLPAGTRATARPLAGCGRCDACRRGLLRACLQRTVTRLRGRIVLAGEPPPGVTFPLEPHRLFIQEQRLIASLGAGESFPAVLGLLESRQVDLAPLLTHRLALDDPPHAFRMVATRTGGALKVVVAP